MARARDALDVLRSYVVERALRAHPHAQDVSGDPSAVPRLSHAEWINVCQLCAAVPEATLRLLHFRWLGEAGTEWATVLVEIQGEDFEVRHEQVARAVPWRQAARLAGLDCDGNAAKAMLGQAVELVHDRMLRRAKGE